MRQRCSAALICGDRNDDDDDDDDVDELSVIIITINKSELM